VVALERSESAVVEAAGGSVAEAGSSDVASDVVSDVVSEVVSVDDDSEVEDDDFLVDVLDFLVVEVALGLTVDMLLLLSRL
jgi:dethiobiotin synthetase